jgi:RNA-directed DNA polymerase
VRNDLSRALASGFLAGEWTQTGLVASGATVLGRRPRWLKPLVNQTLALYPRPPYDRPRELATNIRTRPTAAKAVGAHPLVRRLAGTRMLSNRAGPKQWTFDNRHGQVGRCPASDQT